MYVLNKEKPLNKTFVINSTKKNNTQLPPILRKKKQKIANKKPEKIREFESDSFFWHSSNPEPTWITSYEKVSTPRTYLNGPGPGKYARPTSIGHLNHDITIKTEPAFSICKAERFLDRLDPFYSSSSGFWDRPSTNDSGFVSKTSSALTNGPGPGKYSRLSAIGYQKTDPTLIKQPAYTIGRTERTIDLNSNPFLALPKSSDSNKLTPGPADYAHEKYINKYKISIPAYSIGKAERFPTIIC